jgi:glutamine synthetase
MSNTAANNALSKSQDATTQALWRALSYANIRLVRFYALDVANHPRCKVVPLDRLRTNDTVQVNVAQVCFVGMPSYADIPLPDSGFTAAGVVTLQPQLDTIRRLPYAPQSAIVVCNLVDPLTGSPSKICSRTLLQQLLHKAALEYNVSLNVGVEIEFQLYTLDDRPLDQSNFASTQFLDISEQFWQDLYTDLQQLEVSVEILHTESAPGQGELVLAYIPGNAVAMVDQVFLARETIRNVAHKHQLKTIFLPKVDPMKAGNGCHLHLSIKWHNDEVKPMSLLSQTQQSFLEGVLQHLPALLALTMPTSNSFRRMGKGCWTGCQQAWAREDKEAPLRVIGNALDLESVEHFEYKLCDNTANLYLAISGILLAGLHGVAQKAILRSSLQENPNPDTLPKSLDEALQALQDDTELTKEIPALMLLGYLAVRKAESNRAKNMALSDEVNEALIFA